MKLALTEEQALVESSVLAFLAKEYDFAARRASLAAPHGCRADLWRRFAKLGWLGLPLPESAGGLGAGALETGLLMRAFGRHLVIEPFHACVIVAARLIAALARETQREAWLPSLIDGTSRAALAHHESDAAGPWAPRVTVATRRDGGWVLNGRKSLADGVPGADRLAVSASVGDQTRVFVMAPGTRGLSIRPCLTADDMHAADVDLAGVRVEDDALLGEYVDATSVLNRVLAEAQVAACWEATGAMTAAFEQTAAYVQQRVQFGQPIGRFQVIAHRLAEMAVCCEESRAACTLAALRIDRGEDDATALASMTQSKVERSARYVAAQSVQLHGAMGVTDELPIASHFRKLAAFRLKAGDTGAHSRHYAASQLASGAWRGSRVLPAAAPVIVGGIR